MNIRVEVSSLASPSLSGVSNYTKLLTEALDIHNDTHVSGSYFNFLNRQIVPSVSIEQKLEKNSLVPLKVYAKLQSYNIAPPFDIFLRRVDLTIFPNFATWPAIKSRLRATVIHDLTYLYFPELVEEKNLKHLRRVVPRSIKRADIIITVSEAIKGELVNEFGLDPNKCIVTPIPPDSSYFNENTNEIHKKYSIPTEKFIYFIGNLEPRKNLPVLIEAYRQLPKEIKVQYSLVLAGGNGWKTEKSRATIKAAQDAGENVIHVGFVDTADTGAFYQKASLFVMPSVYEGFGMPILEALASNTPVIASDIPVLRETGGDAVNYADPNSADDFSEKILSALTNHISPADLKLKADAQLSKFSWQKNSDLIITHSVELLK